MKQIMTACPCFFTFYPAKNVFQWKHHKANPGYSFGHQRNSQINEIYLMNFKNLLFLF